MNFHSPSSRAPLPSQKILEFLVRWNQDVANSNLIPWEERLRTANDADEISFGPISDAEFEELTTLTGNFDPLTGEMLELALLVYPEEEEAVQWFQTSSVIAELLATGVAQSLPVRMPVLMGLYREPATRKTALTALRLCYSLAPIDGFHEFVGPLMLENPKDFLSTYYSMKNSSDPLLPSYLPTFEAAFPFELT